MSEAIGRLMILSLLSGMLRSFILTEAVEIPLGWLLGVRDRKGILLVFLANLMTNPAAVLIFSSVGMFWGSKAAAFAAIPIEIAVLLAEWRLYYSRPNMLDADGLIFARGIKNDRREIAALLLALALNIASYGAGAVISYAL